MAAAHEVFQAAEEVSVVSQQLLNPASELRPFLQVTQAIVHKRLHIPHFLTAVIAIAGHQHRINRLLLRQLSNRIGQLDTIPCARLSFSSSAQISAFST